MDVRCARCGIEYEFDDALISERGTMVRCTECGHQFRVHPSHVIPAEPDEWRVVNSSGRTIVYRTLRELQQGITQGDVGRDATLLRGRQSPRPLGSIAELDPFFPTPAGVARQQSTLTGVAPPAAAPPPGPGPSHTTGKVPIARVGLSTIQVPDPSANVEAHRGASLRKTALGIGGSPAAEQSESTSAMSAPIVSAEPENTKPRRSRGSSEPPTLRDGEAPKPTTSTVRIAEPPSKPADKVGSVPPRPRRRTHPTPATGTNAATLVSAANSAEPVLGVPEKPVTDPPIAQRTLTAETQMSAQAPAVFEPTEPMASGEGAASPLHADSTKARAGDEASEDGSPLLFRAESKPIESPPSSPPMPVAESAPDARSFVPTVPPMRATGSQAPRKSAVAPAQSSRIGRWLMVGLFLVLVSLTAVLARYRQAQSGQNASAQSAADLARRLQSARDAIDAGDLGLVHENLQASQSLGARDTRWLTLTARYDIMRADMNWLAVRLADPNDADKMESLKRELTENVAQSIKALNAVERLATADPDIVAARLDAQRLSGDLEQARQAAASLEAGNLSPELAYSLANIELMQQSPRYKEVFEWLGQARAKDSGLGRAPVMLVLACVAGNRLESARAEVQRLKLASRSHPLLAEIEAFVRRAADQKMAAAQAAVVASVDAGEADSIAEVTREGDFRLRLRRAVESLGRNELKRAEQLFRSVLAERPKDTEALAGLGDVARRHGNTANATSYYERVLSSNGQYLPALSALADMKWKSGDRAGAGLLYRRIVDQVGDSPGYGQTATQRLRELGESTNSKANGPSESEKSTSPESSPPAAAPKMDTPDLAGKTP